MTTHSCDLDKFDAAARRTDPGADLDVWTASLAPVLDAQALLLGQTRDALAGRIKRYFPIPAADGRPDRVADLWLEQPIPIRTLQRLRRDASLSDEWIDRYYAHMFDLRARRSIAGKG